MKGKQHKMVMLDIIYKYASRTFVMLQIVPTGVVYINVIDDVL